MALVKISYLFFGRCFLTLYEDNEHFANAPTLLTRTITNLELKDIHVENILINLGLLVILNKILILLVINYYNKIK
jgi:hypothetical protein